MRTSATGIWTRRSPAGRDRGFTLVEILVVLIIVSLMVSLAVLSVSFGGRAQLLEREAERLWQLMRLASDESSLQFRQLGIRFEDNRYRFMELKGVDWQDIDGDPRLRERTLPEGIEVEVEIDGLRISLEKRTLQPKPQIFFLSSGELIPEFALTIGDREPGSSWRIAPGRYSSIALALNE